MLLGSTDLQPGDEVVMINGNLLDAGMTSTEAVNIIKGIKGDVNVVAKRGGTPEVHAQAVPNEVADRAPGNAPAGGIWGTLKYVGPDTQRNACIGCLCCGLPVSPLYNFLHILLWEFTYHISYQTSGVLYFDVS